MHKTFCLVNLQPSNANCSENSIWIAEKPCCSITAVCWSFVEWKHKNCFLGKGIKDTKMYIWKRGLFSLWFVLLSKTDYTSAIKLCWMIIANNITTDDLAHVCDQFTAVMLFVVTLNLKCLIAYFSPNTCTWKEKKQTSWFPWKTYIKCICIFPWIYLNFTDLQQY